MVMVEIGQWHGQRGGIRTGQAGAAEHHRDVVVKDIGGDAAPEQLHDRPRAIAGIDTGPAEFEDLAGIGDQGRDIVFGGRIERTEARRRLAPNQPVGADHGIEAAAATVVEH